jgi:hypothetical protein
MRLSDYLSREAKTPEQFAQEIDVDPVSVRRYVKGARRPKWSVLQRIIDATGGAVTANDFVSMATVRKKRSPAYLAA